MSWALWSRDTREKNPVSFSSIRCPERLLSRHWNSDLKLRPPRRSSLRRSSVGLKHHWSFWGTMEPRTTKRKNCKTFYAKRESVMRLPKDTALNQMDWPRDSTSPSWTRFAACLSMQWSCAAHYAVLIYNKLPRSALDDHKSPNDAYGDSSDFSKLCVFGSISYALQSSKLLHKLEKYQQKDSFLELILLATKFSTYKAKLLL